MSMISKLKLLTLVCSLVGAQLNAQDNHDLLDRSRAALLERIATSLSSFGSNVAAVSSSFASGVVPAFKEHSNINPMVKLMSLQGVKALIKEYDRLSPEAQALRDIIFSKFYVGSDWTDKNMKAAYWSDRSLHLHYMEKIDDLLSAIGHDTNTWTMMFEIKKNAKKEIGPEGLVVALNAGAAKTDPFAN